MNSKNPLPTLYDPASPNAYDPFQSPIDNADRPPSAQHCNPKFLDLDDPGPTDRLSLTYEDQTPSSGRIQQAILTRKEAADVRNGEADTLFGTIANILDQHCACNPHMPVHMSNALKKFCDELVEVATRHFDAYVRGTPVPSVTDRSSPAYSSSSSARNTKSSLQTYANAAKRNSDPSSAIGKSTTRPTQNQHSKKQTDDRLFLRLPIDSPLRSHSGYALQTILKTKLGPEGHLISNILPTKTGFAICPSKGNTAALEEKIVSENFFGADAHIEKASPWTSYRISNVPRSFGAIDENLKHCLLPVTVDAVKTAVTAAAGTPPVSITASRNNEASPDSSSTSWIVRFPESHNQLPRILYLFGCRTNTRVLPQRLSVSQCTRCWQWHNTRICASSPRCRLCGSSKHAENDHKSLCAASVGHICPPRCIHCHGPHPADDESLLKLGFK